MNSSRFRPTGLKSRLCRTILVGTVLASQVSGFIGNEQESRGQSTQAAKRDTLRSEEHNNDEKIDVGSFPKFLDSTRQNSPSSLQSQPNELRLNLSEIPKTSSIQTPSQFRSTASSASGPIETSQSGLQPLHVRQDGQRTPTVVSDLSMKVHSLEQMTEASNRFQLRNLAMVDFEAKLKEIWQSELQSAVSPDGRYSRFSLSSLSQDPMVMLVDRQTGELTYEGEPELKGSWYRLMSEIDSRSVAANGEQNEVKMILHPQLVDVEKVMQTAYQLTVSQDNGVPIPQGNQDEDELLGTVRVFQDPNTGLIVVVGEGPDAELIRREIEILNQETLRQRRQIQSLTLRNAQASSIAETIQEIYNANYQFAYGPAEIRANTVNNTLVIVAQETALAEIKKIVAEFDIEGDPEQIDNFKSIQLKYLSAADAKVRLDLYFGQIAPGVGTGIDRLPIIPVVSIADYRTNIITIKGSQQSILEAERYLKQIDIDDTDAAFELKVIKVFNRLAEELAVIVQDAINGQQPNAGQGFKGLQQLGIAQLQQPQVGQINPQQSNLSSRSLILRDPDAGDVVASGILFEARITADRDANTLIVSAPGKSIALIEKLVRELDRIPDIEVQMKIFNVVNGDAFELLSTLQSLFGTGQFQQQAQVGGLGAQGGIQNQLPLQSAGVTPGASLVNLRFAVDSRTNSILATGPVGELQVVEALLNRLDEFRPNDRINRVYRLSNAPVADVADAINEWLATRDQINELDPRAIGDINQTNRRVVVVPEINSNSLLIQARPEYIQEIEDIVLALDRRPAMVKVKILLAEVDLSRLEEFGIDFGVQDSILFDRGTTIGAGGDILGGIGFPFNQSGVGNLNATARSTVAGQGLSNLGTGRTNSDLGYGGLVLSAGSESVNVLLRALQNRQCVRVLSKPHIMTMENLQGRFQTGASVPRVAGTTNTAFGVAQDVVFQDVGVIIEVTPRVSPDGMIVMVVTASKSSVGPEATGIPVSVGLDGSVIRAPQILQTVVRTTLMAQSGRTMVLSGLIQESKANVRRGVPILSDIPVIGPLFRFESDEAVRNELLIIMTPYLVTDDDDVETMNFEEMDRMHWCVEDVAEIYGNTNYLQYNGDESGIETIYPNVDPTGMGARSDNR